MNIIISDVAVNKISNPWNYDIINIKSLIKYVSHAVKKGSSKMNN